MLKEVNNINSQKVQYRILYLYSILIVFAGLLMGPPLESIKQLWTLVISPCYLFTDYFYISSIGTALINSGLLMFLAIFIANVSKTEISGLLIASIFIVTGFALFGKNLYNVVSIYLGVYLYSRFKKESFSKYVTMANFATSLTPLVSQVSYGMNFEPVSAIILANVIGLIVGFIFSPLANSFAAIHRGFNIYNGGFTSGIIGMLFMSIFRMTDYDHFSVKLITDKTDNRLVIFLFIFFLSMIITGYIKGKKTLKEYSRILSYSGMPKTDFVALEGFDSALVNMGIMGISATVLALIFKAPLNGLVTGAILTVVGFSALSKNLFNTIPIVVGVVLAYTLAGRFMSDTVCMINALFATSLAPVAGVYGLPAGMLAGFLHAVLVGNLAYLHGWMNLYNNGFSAGFIAAILVGILEIFKKEK
ncbi:MAG: DUF1576 domain-containing protein [Bacillota bacterium]|jgi:hypothetical protein|nr:DUF1576 domain-containing protein [Bacillota bacterium]NLL26873.1 DUF1576 domain-containing protein [Erysipelotrichia bacterium]